MSFPTASNCDCLAVDTQPVGARVLLTELLQPILTWHFHVCVLQANASANIFVLYSQVCLPWFVVLEAACVHYHSYYHLLLRAVPEIILRGGATGTFWSCGGEGVLLTRCPRGGGVTCPGGQSIFDPEWGGLIKALTCPGGHGGLWLHVCPGAGGVWKKMRPPPPRIISGTALTCIADYDGTVPQI